MATNRAMLKEAIADAKAVKETAIANAKAALEEAFTPQLKSMLSLKLQEMEEEEDLDEAGFGPMINVKGHGNIEDESSLYEEEKDMMEVDLEELLAELNEEEEEMEENLYEAEEGEEDEESEESEEGEEEGEPMDLEDMTDEDLKDMIEDVIKDMIESGELEAGHEEGEEEEGEEMEMSDEEEVDLAELLREIEDMDENMDEEMEEGMYEEEVEEGLLGKIGTTLGDIFGGGSDARKAAEISKEIIDGNKDLVNKWVEGKDKQALMDLKRLAYNAFAKAKIQDPRGHLEDFSRELVGDPRSFLQKLAAGTTSQTAAREGMEEELAEAYSTIESLKNELNEINLLNAKLLYSNKIFKSKNLNESQKVKVLSSFDKANTVGEVKMVFETLNEGIKVNKTTIKENLGRASKTTGAPTVKKPIVESNEAFLRMQKLAGII
jgi:hypothetical protein